MISKDFNDSDEPLAIDMTRLRRRKKIIQRYASKRETLTGFENHWLKTVSACVWMKERERERER